MKQLLLIDDISFIFSYYFYWKPFVLVEAIPFSFSVKPYCFWWRSLPVIETNPFSGSLFFLVEAWWKLLLLIKTFPFSRSHSFWCFNIFTSRSYQKLRELLNINNSARLLKMVNLSCIHIPGEIFRAQMGI